MALKKTLNTHYICLVLSILLSSSYAMGDGLPEYRLKTAFIFNFIAYTQWPIDLGAEVNLCIVGKHGFGDEIDSLNGRQVNQLSIVLALKKFTDDLQECEAIFVASDSIHYMPEMLEAVENKPVLTIADTENAIEKGIMLNMLIDNNNVIFEANQKVARNAGLFLNAQLLRLAAKVYQ